MAHAFSHTTAGRLNALGVRRQRKPCTEHGAHGGALVAAADALPGLRLPAPARRIRRPHQWPRHALHDCRERRGRRGPASGDHRRDGRQREPMYPPPNAATFRILTAEPLVLGVRLRPVGVIQRADCTRSPVSLGNQLRSVRRRFHRPSRASDLSGRHGRIPPPCPSGGRAGPIPRPSPPEFRQPTQCVEFFAVAHRLPGTSRRVSSSACSAGVSEPAGSAAARPKPKERRQEPMGRGLPASADHLLNPPEGLPGWRASNCGSVAASSHSFSSTFSSSAAQTSRSHS